MKFPSIANVAARLREINDNDGDPDDADNGIDVRLCVDSDGTWCVRWGLVDYDPAHSYLCGSGLVPGWRQRFDSRECARDLIEQCRDQYHEQGADDTLYEPDEDDYTTADHRRWYQSGKLVLELGPDDDHVKALKAHMQRQGFYPNAWFISDHGNAHLINLK